MKLFFINPPSVFGFTEVGVWIEPLGLAYIAGTCREAGHDVRIRDMFNTNIDDLKSLFREIDEFRPDVIGFTAMTENFKNGLEIAKAAKSRYGCPIIFGGWHVSGEPSTVLNPEIDYVVVGEGEETVLELLDVLQGKLDRKLVNGLAYKTDDGFQVNEKRPRIKKLTAIPRPMREGLPVDRYRWPSMMVEPTWNLNTLSVQASRGCPYKCTFCQTPALWGSAWTSRTPESVVDEIEQLINEHGANHIFFRDEEFTVRSRWVIEICNEIVRRGLQKRFQWGSFARADDITPELAEAMWQAGGRAIIIGLEATSRESGENMKKYYDLEQASEALHIMARRGFFVYGSWIIGFPWDTEESLQAGFDWMLRQPVDLLNIFFVIPFPGTEFRRQVEEQGLLLVDDTSRYNLREVVVKTPHISTERLFKLRGEFTRRYYLRTSYFRQIIGRMFQRPRLAYIIPQVIIDYLARGRVPNMGNHTTVQGQASVRWQLQGLPTELYEPLCSSQKTAA